MMLCSVSWTAAEMVVLLEGFSLSTEKLSQGGHQEPGDLPDLGPSPPIAQMVGQL